MTNRSAVELLNQTGTSPLGATNFTPCVHYEDLVETWFAFDSHQLTRVIVTWVISVLGAIGNVFVLVSLRQMKRFHHVLMFHLALADLLYACTVLPIDAIWNTTMQWYTGHGLCKFGQMVKQFGMYSSSLMIVVISVDRVMAIVHPTKVTKQEKLGNILVGIAWIVSFLCTIPAALLFSIREVPTCENMTITQCVDNMEAPKSLLHIYHFFTMFISFLLPFTTVVISYSMIICEITKMKEREMQLMGRRDGLYGGQMQKAIKKTALMRTLICLTFLVCWAPYYVIGIIDWFFRDMDRPERPYWAYEATYILMYFNCLLHPIVFGIFLQEVRDNFCTCFGIRAKKRFTKSSAVASTNNNIVKYKRSQLASSDNQIQVNG